MVHCVYYIHAKPTVRSKVALMPAPLPVAMSPASHVFVLITNCVQTVSQSGTMVLVTTLLKDLHISTSTA